MKTYAITTIAGCLMIAGFTFWADPTHRWWRQTDMVTRRLSPGEALMHPPDVDERQRQISLLKHAPRPDTVYLGSSRAMLVDSSMHSPSLNVLNLSVSGASVEDYVAFWQALIETAKVPKSIMIFVDPWVFNSNSGQMRWKSNRAYFDRFQRDREAAGHEGRGVVGQLASWARRIWSEFDYSWLNVTELMNWSNFKVSLEFARDRFRARNSPDDGVRIVQLEQIRATSPGTRWDGSHIYPIAALKPVGGEGLEGQFLEFANAAEVYSISRWELNPKAVLTLTELVAGMKRRGVRVTLVSPPYPIQVLRLLSLRPEYRPVIPQYRSILDSISKSEGTRFCDVVDGTAAGCTDAEFMDGMHALPVCIQKVVKYCSSRGES